MTTEVTCGCPSCCARNRLDADRDAGAVDEFSYGVAERYLTPCLTSVFKRAAVQALLDQHPAVMVQLDATAPGADVPSHLRASGLQLRFGRGLTPPIADLELSDAAICGTLRFSGAYYRCVVPWSSVSAAWSEDKRVGFNWAAGQSYGAAPEPPPVENKRPALKLVD